MSRRTHPAKPPDTHYCDWDAPGGRLVRALCGAFIKRLEHANEPTCGVCRAVLAEREQEETPWAV